MPGTALLALELCAVLGLLTVCSFAPGFFFIRRFAWSPMEKLCGSVGLSLLLVYLAAWAVYCFGPRAPAVAYSLVAALSVAAAIAAWRDIVRLRHSAPSSRVLAGFVFLLLWTFLMLAAIRVYSGATWSTDWLEHFQRCLFFLRRFPPNTPIFPVYQLPARPPMMNVLGAFFLGLTSDRFEIFQLVFAFLNLLLFLACCLVLPALAKSRRRPTLLLTALFAASPVLMENVTYSWTKALAAFYVILGLWFYLAGWRKHDARRTLAAFVFLSAALLVHYSAAPYCLFLAAHYTLRVLRGRRREWRQLAVIVAVCSLLLATWFGWSVALYGARGAFASNTSVTSSEHLRGHNLEKFRDNLIDTFIPLVLRSSPLPPALHQPNPAGRLRDAAFIFYQHNAIFAMGVVGGPLVLWLLYRSFRRPSRERWFWAALVPFCLVVGIAATGERESLGVAHLTLLSLVALGLSLLAVAASRRRALLIAVLIGCVVDFSLGVYLQAHVQSLENSPGGEVYTSGLSQRTGSPQIGNPVPAQLSEIAWVNWYQKHRFRLCADWLAMLDRYQAAGGAPERLLSLSRANLREELRADAVYFDNWYARHGDTLDYLGDRVASLPLGGAPAMALLMLLFLALMGTVLRRELSVPPPPAPRPAKASPTRKRPRRSRS
jgi:hypothetical protein